MTIEVLGFIFGCILVLIGIIGGGLEVKELKIPKVGWPTRILAIIGGIVFISFGFIFPDDEPPSRRGNDVPVEERTPQLPQAAKDENVEFTVVNELGLGQISEDVQIYIEGRLVGELLVDKEHNMVSIKINVSSSGSYPYVILADGVFVNQFGQLYRSRCRGDGVIEVNEGAVFRVALTPHGIRLVPR